MPQLLTAADLAGQFRGFRRAFRVEARDAYWLGYEEAEFALFLAGQPRPPEQVGWWRDYLTRLDGWRHDGREVCRVLLDWEGDSPYKRWRRWCEQFHTRHRCGDDACPVKTGEDMLHMPGSLAEDLGLPLYDFWLFEDED